MIIGVCTHNLEDRSLADLERFARSIIDALPVHLAVLDDHGTIITVNKAWRDFGVANQAVIGTVGEGANYLDTCDRAVGHGAENAAAFAAGVRAVIKGQLSDFSLEYSCHSPVMERWFIGRVNRLHLRGPARVIVSHENSTVRKQSEERFRRTEEWLRAIFEASRDGILVEDDERIMYVNGSYARLLGYQKPEDLIGNHISTILTPVDQVRMLEFGRQRMRGGNPPSLYEFKGKRKDGTLIPLEASVSTHRVRGKTYITTSIRDIADRKRNERALRDAHSDLERRVAERTNALANTNAKLQAEITDRRRAEETLRESGERLNIAVQTSGLGFWQLDLAGGLFVASEICKANFGFSPDAQITHHDLLAAVHPDDRDRVRAAVKQALSERFDYEAQYRVVWPDGSCHWISGRGRGMYDPDGQPLRMIGVTLDITARKHNEEARQALLRRLVKAQEDERCRISRELHDQMGQHITALMLGLKSLEGLSQTRSSSLALVRQLQEISRQIDREVDRLAIELRPSALDDVGLNAALTQLLAEWSARSGIPVYYQCGGIDVNRLPLNTEITVYRVTQEALTNILKHAQATSVSLMLERRSDQIITIIEDDGTGFNICELRKGSGDQSRLGLLGINERVAQVGGTFDIESTPGKGTTLFLRIPVSSDSRGRSYEQASSLLS